MYRDMIDDIIEKNGVSCRFFDDNNEITVKAFFQPLRYKYGSYSGTCEEEGLYDERKYLYIGKAENDLTVLPTGFSMESGSILYSLESADMYYLGETAVYCRAVFRRVRGDV